MHGSDDDRLIARIADELRRPVPLHPHFDARVMASVRRVPPSLPRQAWSWLREPRTLALSPLGGLAMAAGLAGVLFVGVWSARPAAIGHRPSAVSAGTEAAAVQALAAGAPAPMTFILVAPDAGSVALAGDFNGWEPSHTPMRREASGLWTVDVPLAPGRYRYAFVVDGRRFVADPSAPRAAGDDFGTPTSVVTVAGGAIRAAGGSL